MARKLSAAKQHASIENISVFGVRGRMGPLALWMYANAYLRAAKGLPGPVVPFEPVRHFLVCQFLELLLKASLSLNGATLLELADGAYGHNLEALLDAAKATARPLAISCEHCSEIRKASKYYVEKVFQYPAVGEAMRVYPHLPDFDILVEAAGILEAALEAPCREAP